MEILNIPTRSLTIFANTLSEVIDSRLSAEFDEDERTEYTDVFRNILYVLRSREDFEEGQVNEPMTIEKIGRAMCKVEVGFLLSAFSTPASG